MIHVVSGPMAAGKTTVARWLAERFERGVHLEGDVFHRMIVRGRAEMTADASPDAFEQLRLRYRLAAGAADAYAEAGFDVVLEDVIAGVFLDEVRTAIRKAVFRRRAASVAGGRSRPRCGARSRRVRVMDRRRALYDVFERETPRVGQWIDTTTLTAEETVDAILGRHPVARAAR